MPLLTRMVGIPLCVDVRAGAVAGLAPLLADRRISSGGQVAVAAGSSRCTARASPASKRRTSSSRRSVSPLAGAASAVSRGAPEAPVAGRGESGSLSFDWAA